MDLYSSSNGAVRESIFTVVQVTGDVLSSVVADDRVAMQARASFENFVMIKRLFMDEEEFGSLSLWFGILKP